MFGFNRARIAGAILWCSVEPHVMEEFTFLNTCKITVGALVLIFTGVLLAMNDKVALQLESLVAELTRMVSVRALR